MPCPLYRWGNRGSESLSSERGPTGSAQSGARPRRGSPSPSPALTSTRPRSRLAVRVCGATRRAPGSLHGHGVLSLQRPKPQAGAPPRPPQPGGRDRSPAAGAASPAQGGTGAEARLGPCPVAAWPEGVLRPLGGQARSGSVSTFTGEIASDVPPMLPIWLHELAEPFGGPSPFWGSSQAQLSARPGLRAAHPTPPHPLPTLSCPSPLPCPLRIKQEGKSDLAQSWS